MRGLSGILRWSIVACILAVFAWGDVLPYPGEKRSGSRSEVQLPAISMQRATVEVVLKPHASKLTAVVKAEFKMVCSKGNQPPDNFTMAMPVVEGSQKTSYRILYLKIDGKAVATSKARKTSWPSHAGGQVLYQGFVWPDPILRGAEQTVTIAYELTEKANPRGGWQFTYILKSGAAWSGPIGHESVRIRPEKGLQMQPTPFSLQPRRQPDGSVVWEIDNQKPTEDVTVEITPIS
jgi:hypothetical protein